MTDRYQQDVLAAREELSAPPPQRACEDHNFGLPTGIYVAMAICFGGAMTVLAITFRGGMAVSYGVIFTFLAAFFIIPLSFVKSARGEGQTKALDWHGFVEGGIPTANGKASAVEATTLVLLIPFLVLCWAIAFALIATLA